MKTREPLYAIVWTATGLAVVPAVEVTRRASLLKKHHADAILEKLTADTVTVSVREDFGPGELAQ